MAIFLVFFNYALWSSIFTIGKASLTCASPLFLTGTRMLAAGVLMIAALALFRPQALKFNRAQLATMGLLGLFSVYLANALEFWGLQYLTAAKTCLIYSLTPFISALLSYFQFGEKMTPLKAAGLTIGFMSFIPILLDRSGAEELVRGLGWLTWAEIALMGAAVSAAYGWILLKLLGTRQATSPIAANAVSMAFGGILALAHSFFIENWSPVPVTNTRGFFEGLALMIVISNIICYNIYGWLLKKFSATFLSFAGLTTPLFAALFGYLFLKETITPYFFVALGVIAVGLALVYIEERKQGYIRPSAD